MKLNPPRRITWLVALVLVVIGLLASLGTVPVLSDYAFWFELAAAILLLLATLLAGL